MDELDAAFYTSLYKILSNTSEMQTAKLSDADQEFLSGLADYWNSLESEATEDVA